MVNLHEVVKIANIINYINVRLPSFVYLITSSTLNIKSQINSNYTFLDQYIEYNYIITEYSGLID